MTMQNAVDGTSRPTQKSNRKRTVFLAMMAVASSCILPIAGYTSERETPRISLQTNQHMIESLQRSSSVKVTDAISAFKMVFDQLPDEVFVVPTENYYYYKFTADGAIYAGNIRLAAQDRDRGVVHFAIFQQATAALGSSKILYKALDAKVGVTVKQLQPLLYAVTFGEKIVRFRLNDVSDITPPKRIVADGEEYLGAVVDESGIRFFLFYNRRLKLFAYVLDETKGVLDQLEPLEERSRIFIGARTSFAFYQHHHLDRKVLIGVHDGNTYVNNYFDGPADQLPENHIKDDNLRKAIVDAAPAMKDQLDTFGYLKSGEGRYLIAPYIQYQSQDELLDYDVCATSTDVPKDQYDGCFHAGEE
jgi:hypothetical protein